MDLSKRFNQLLILVVLLILTLFAKLALAEDASSKTDKNCYYGTETQHNLKDLKNLSQFVKNTEFDTTWVEYQYNGYSVSKQEFERLKLRDANKKGDINLLKP